MHFSELSRVLVSDIYRLQMHEINTSINASQETKVHLDATLICTTRLTKLIHEQNLNTP